MQMVASALTLYLPVLLALGLAFRPGRRLQRPWTFVLVAPALGYGLAAMTVLFVEVPLGVLHILVAPGLEACCLDLAWWWLSVRWFNDHDGLLHLIVALAWSTATTLWLSRRWQGLIRAVPR